MTTANPLSLAFAPAFGLYTHIQANRRRSIFLLAALFALLHALSFAGALIAVALSREGDLAHLVADARDATLLAAPYVTAGALAWIWIGWEFNRRIIALAVPDHPLTRADAPDLYDMVETLCVSRGMKTPRLAIVETPEPNAFASGVNEAQYTITFTRGLLDLLTPAELEAVAAHELTHIRNGDVRMMVVAMIIAGVVTFFAEMIFRLMGDARGWRFARGAGDRREEGGGERGRGGAAAAIALALIVVAAAWALSLMIRLALSRTREYLADAGSVELTKNPDAMISALRKIEGKGELPGAPSGVMEMCLDNPRSGFADLFSSHPSIADRVAALARYASGRDDAAAQEDMR
jgi:heat shock protein HtpX